MAVSGVSHACVPERRRRQPIDVMLQIAGSTSARGCPHCPALIALPWLSAAALRRLSMKRGVEAFVLSPLSHLLVFSRLLHADRQPCSHRAIILQQVSLRARVAVQQCSESHCNVNSNKHNHILYRPIVLPYLGYQYRRLSPTIILYRNRV